MENTLQYPSAIKQTVWVTQKKELTLQKKENRKKEQKRSILITPSHTHFPIVFTNQLGAFQVSKQMMHSKNIPHRMISRDTVNLGTKNNCSKSYGCPFISRH